MKIIVCVKQVPATQNVKLDEETGTLLRSGVKSKLNPYDLFAIEAALELKERFGGEVALLTMGPPQARNVLTEGLCMGADSGALLCDARFAGSDVYATALALSGAVRTLGKYDIILTGKQTTDGDTAQVGPELAELLGIPHACNVFDIRAGSGASYAGGKTNNIESGGARNGEGEAPTNLIVTQNAGSYQIRLRFGLPCLLAVDKDINTPRLPSYIRGKTLKDEMIATLTMDDIISPGAAPDETNYGAAGSPTHVDKVFPPPERADRIIYEGANEKLAGIMADILTNSKYLD